MTVELRDDDEPEPFSEPAPLDVDEAALMRELEDEVVFATMHFDGGGQAPGPIGGGVVIELADGREHESSFYLLDGTHNVAEYTALAHGLDCVLRLGVTHVNIFGDSRLVVEQVNGRWRCRNSALDQLRRAVMSKLDSLESWSLNWTPRNSNRRADALATAAISEGRA